MSVNLNLAGPVGPPVSYVLTASEADAWVPTNRVLLVGWHVTNRNGSNRQVDVYWSDGTTSNHFATKTVPTVDGWSFSDIAFVIDPNATNGNGVAKKIRAKAAVATDLTITFSFVNIMPQQSLPGTAGRGGGGAAHS